VTTAFTKASSASPPATTKTAFWNQPLAAALTDFGTSAEGLVSAEAERRLQQYGRNDATGPHRPHAVVRFMGRFRNPLVIILLVASALSAVTGDVASFSIVVTIVLLSVLLDFVQETRAQTAVDALQQKVALRTGCPAQRGVAAARRRCAGARRCSHVERWRSRAGRRATARMP